MHRPCLGEARGRYSSARTYPSRSVVAGLCFGPGRGLDGSRPEEVADERDRILKIAFQRNGGAAQSSHHGSIVHPTPGSIRRHLIGCSLESFRNRLGVLFTQKHGLEGGAYTRQATRCLFYPNMFHSMSTISLTGHQQIKTSVVDAHSGVSSEEPRPSVPSPLKVTH